VAKRGDVLVARRKLGFGAAGRAEHFAVLQADRLQDLETILVAPLDVFGPLYQTGDPLVVPVSAKEAGAKQEHVVLVYLLSAMLRDRFEPAAVGKLTSASLVKIEDVLRVALAV
jgi:hypothetical protein